MFLLFCQSMKVTLLLSHINFRTRRLAPTRAPQTERPLSKSSEVQTETERFDIRIIVGLSLGVFVGIVAIGLIFKYLK